MLPDNIFDAYTMLGNHGKLQKVYALLIYDKAWERKKKQTPATLFVKMSKTGRVVREELG